MFGILKVHKHDFDAAHYQLPIILKMERFMLIFLIICARFLMNFNAVQIFIFIL